MFKTLVLHAGKRADLFHALGTALYSCTRTRSAVKPVLSIEVSQLEYYVIYFPILYFSNVAGRATQCGVAQSGDKVGVA